MYGFERLKNIHIDDYSDSASELSILAVMRLYLNTMANPEREIELALESQAGLETVLKRAKDSIVLEESYAENIKLILSVFKETFNAHDVAERYGDSLNAFLMDAMKELKP